MRTISPAQNACMIATALYENARAAADAEIAATLTEPADYCANEEAALAYEEAVIAVERKHDVDNLRRLCRLAEDTLIDWAVGECAALNRPEFREVQAALPAMRVHMKHRARLVATCLRLAA